LIALGTKADRNKDRQLTYAVETLGVLRQELSCSANGSLLLFQDTNDVDEVIHTQCTALPFVVRFASLVLRGKWNDKKPMAETIP
jgi:hypothetical protein